MYQHQPNTSHIQSRLLQLQNGYPMVEGLMLVSYGGFVLASTFKKDDNVSRLAAVSRTMFLLADDACRDMGRGTMQSVHLSYKRERGGDDNTASQVIMRAMSDSTMLVIALHSPMRSIGSLDDRFLGDIERMISFIALQIAHEL